MIYHMEDIRHKYLAPELELVQSEPCRTIATSGNIDDYNTGDFNWGD